MESKECRSNVEGRRIYERKVLRIFRDSATSAEKQPAVDELATGSSVPKVVGE
jgi:hypothetical protein